MSRNSKSITSGFSPVLIICLLLVSVACLAGMGLMAAYEPELKSGNNGGNHALSQSSVGFAALPKLLQATGTPVLFSRGPLNSTSDRSLQILTPTATTTLEDIDETRHDGAVLVVLPKWGTVPHPKKPGWVQTHGLMLDRDAVNAMDVNIVARSIIQTRTTKATEQLYRPDGTPFGRPVTVNHLRTISGPDWVPVLVDEGQRPVLVMNIDDRSYLLADPDLLNTQGLKDLDNARTALEMLQLIRAKDAPVVFDLTLHGFISERNLLRLLLEPPLLGMTLVLVALAAFAGYQAMIRFGSAEVRGRALAMGKIGLADNTAGLVRLARREHKMATPYALLTRMAVARAIGAPRRLSEAELEAFLDRVSQTTGASTTYTALDQQARAAKTPGDLMQVAIALYRWNQELTRARQ